MSASDRFAPALLLLNILCSVLATSSPVTAAQQSVAADSGEEVEITETVLDEITVTAQHREDRLIEVPVAVTALTGTETVELQLSTVSELASQVPNLQIDSAWGGANNPTIFLRGVGTDDVNPTADGAVAIYSDQAYLSGPARRVLELFDLERVEVLRGPQGSLYGKNTTGGAIRLITHKPAGAWGGQARVGFGRFSQTNAEGALDLPLAGEANGVRLALLSNQRDGLTRNLFDGGKVNDIDASAARLGLRLVPRKNLSASVQLRGGLNRGGMTAMQMRGLLDGANLFGYVESADPFSGSYNRTPLLDIERLGASATIAWLGQRVSVTSISAWEKSKKTALDDADASPFQIGEINWNDDAWSISQELRAASIKTSRFDWIAGAFYAAERLEVDNSFDILRALRSQESGFNPLAGIFVIDQVYSQDTESFAPFGHLTLRLTDRTNLRVGLRHTWETRDIDFRTAFDEPGIHIPLINVLDEVRANEFSGGVGLDHAPTPNLLMFFNARRGFKSGGFNGGALFAAEEVSSVEPEFVTSLEAGFKASWHAGRLTFSATSFLYDYEDLQVFNFVNAGGLPVQILDNAGQATVQGLELELRARPHAALDLALSLGLLDAHYDEFIQNDGADFSGNRLTQAPRWDASGYLKYSWDLAVGRVVALTSFTARDDVFFDPTNNPEIGAQGYTLFDGRISWQPSTKTNKWTVSLWGKNLADERYFREVVDVSNFGFHKFIVGDPRTYGVEIGTRF